MWPEVWAIFRKDMKLEMRQSHALGSVLLYILSSVFVAYLAFKRIGDVPTWNALFWIIVLFAAFNAAARSFALESSGRRLYLYTLASPQSVILAKIIYNACILLVMVSFGLLIFSGLLGTDVLREANGFALMGVVMLGALGLSVQLSLVSALAATADQNLGLMAVLGLPIILPFLLILMRLSKNVLDGLAWSVNASYVWQLIAITVLSVALSYILFPYLWRE